MEWAYNYAPEIQGKGALVGLTRGGFPPSSVHMDSRITDKTHREGSFAT